MSGHDPELRATETFQFRGRLADAARQPEFMRADSIGRILRQILICPYLTQNECFEAVYGPDGARKFWEVLSAEPIKISVFVDLLATTRARDKDEKRILRDNLWVAMLDAYQADERTWFVGDATPFEGARFGWQVAKAKGLGGLKVRAKDAAEWLLHMPMRRHLVPEWLVTVLHPAQPLGPQTAKVGTVDVDSKPRNTEQALKTWFEERHLAWPDNQPAPSEKRDVSDAMDYFAPGLVRDKIRKVRLIATPEAWRRRGPRRLWGEAKLDPP